jgi:dihydroxyacetone kinase DhaKLM complex PTS-EIIA-like component DhaM
MASERIKFIKYGGKDILCLDFVGCNTTEVVAVIEEAKRVIRTQPEGSLLTLTDVTDARFNQEVTERMKEFTANNKPYVKAAAIVGISGIKKIIFEAVMMFSKRKIHIFENMNDAKEWLITN